MDDCLAIVFLINTINNYYRLAFLHERSILDPKNTDRCYKFIGGHHEDQKNGSLVTGDRNISRIQWSEFA